MLIYRPRRDERLSWPGWLTYSGRYTHISGHPSTTGRAQNRESSPAKDRRSATEPRNQPTSWICCQLINEVISFTFIIHAGMAAGAGRAFSRVCVSVRLRSNRKTAWAINIKLSACILYSSRSACIDPVVKRSGHTAAHGCYSDHGPYSTYPYAAVSYLRPLPSWVCMLIRLPMFSRFKFFSSSLTRAPSCLELRCTGVCGWLQQRSQCLWSTLMVMMTVMKWCRWLLKLIHLRRLPWMMRQYVATWSCCNIRTSVLCYQTGTYVTFLGRHIFSVESVI